MIVPLSFVKNLNIIILLSLIIFIENSYSQNISYIDDSINIRLELLENDKKQINFELIINNLSNYDIYLLDLAINNTNVDSISKDFHISNLGGGWHYLHGYEQIFDFIKITRGDSLQKSLSFIVTSNITSDFQLFDRINGNFINKDQILIVFNLGYFINKDYLVESKGIDTKNQTIQINMNYEKIGFRIEQLYKRPFVLFPVLVK